MSEQAPDDRAPGANEALAALLKREILESGGAIPFDRFMERALYEPGLGYYTDPRRQRVGRDGDFITSVSVGRCFGLLLARHLAPRLEAMAEGWDGGLVLAEPGPEGGRLAVDVMQELARVLPAERFARLTYVAVEPAAEKRAVLASALQGGGIARARVVADWSELASARGAVMANEVLDALPVKRFRARGGRWFELGVGVADDGGSLVERELDRGGRELHFGGDAPPVDDGFEVERCPALDAFFEQVSSGFDQAYACFIDYGLERSVDFLDPGRRDGTLRGYRGQRLVGDLLSEPGGTDLTSHVDFERARMAAERAGFGFVALGDQHRFLVQAARGWLLEIEARGGVPDAETAKLLRQFQSLSHPSAMGAAFKVLELEKRRRG